MTSTYRLTELMVVRCAKEIKDGEVVFAGVGLPLVVVSFAMATHAPNMILLTEGGSIRATAPPGLAISVDDAALFTNADATYGMIATMGTLQRGEVDVAFIGGSQIDKFGNINSTGCGQLDHSRDLHLFRRQRRRQRHGHIGQESPRHHAARSQEIRREGGLPHHPRLSGWAWRS